MVLAATDQPRLIIVIIVNIQNDVQQLKLAVGTVTGELAASPAFAPERPPSNDIRYSSALLGHWKVSIMQALDLILSVAGQMSSERVGTVYQGKSCFPTVDNWGIFSCSSQDVLSDCVLETAENQSTCGHV